MVVFLGDGGGIRTGGGEGVGLRSSAASSETSSINSLPFCGSGLASDLLFCYTSFQDEKMTSHQSSEDCETRRTWPEPSTWSHPLEVYLHACTETEQLEDTF